MSNKNQAEASLEDARNTAESLFGDSVAAPNVVVGKEQEVRNEPEQNQQGSDPAEEEHVGEAETASQGDLKVVVSITGGRASIGVQRPSSDPHIESFEDLNVSELAQEVPAVLERARARWDEAPNHPAYERPSTSTGRRPRRNQGSAQASTEEGEAVQQETQTMRLF